MGKGKTAKSVEPTSARAAEARKKKNLLQSDVPSYSLDDALAIPRAIMDEYAGEPTRPLEVVRALQLSPASSGFRMKCGAATAYGLTDGGYKLQKISVLPLAKRILKPTEEGDDVKAKREGFLKPRVIGVFLTKYDGSKFPRDDIALNVLSEMGVPTESAKVALELILTGAKHLGLLSEIKGNLYVNLRETVRSIVPPSGDSEHGSRNDTPVNDAPLHRPESAPALEPFPPPSAGHSRQDFRKKRVFITHGKQKAFIEPIKKLLGFGELEAIVSVERQTVSVGVPEKVMNEMRSCGAAIIHVDAEQTLLDKEANEHVVLNGNVLIEIGAAMALYGKRFILLVRDGLKLPSNLQGLLEVRYVGDAMDGNATIRLLEAINDIKNHALPE